MVIQIKARQLSRKYGQVSIVRMYIRLIKVLSMTGKHYGKTGKHGETGKNSS